MDKKNVLILCGGNSCRSQMVEGFFKFYACKEANIYSAGIETKGIHPMAIASMAEEGIDLRDHTCNNIAEYSSVDFDYVITVCELDKRCPEFSERVQQFHYTFPDPTASATLTEEELAEAFREVRGQLKSFSMSFVDTHLRC